MNKCKIFIRSLLLVLCISLVAGCTLAKNEESADHPADKIVISTLEAIGARGGSITIKVADSEMYSATYGIGYDLHKPVTLASLSKPVTSYILLQMEIDGLINVNSPIGSYVPEISELQNGSRIIDKTLFDFMTHNTGIVSLPLDSSGDWKKNLEAALSDNPTQGRVYSNENYALLTRVVINTLGSYEDALRKYINVGGITTFRVGSKFSRPSYAGVGGLESTTADYYKFMERSAPLSEVQSDGFGISWFHGEAGFVWHQGMIAGGGRDQHALALWGATSASGAVVSIVFQADAFDTDALLIEQLLRLF
ncbi:MAG: serine hydrolase [Pseudohongiella sp.]|nr:serine hydrolase [Pseudohongiella sp.]